MSYYNESINPKLSESVEFHSDGSFALDFEKQEHIICFLDKQLESNPNDTDLLSRKGQSLSILEKYDDAIECFDRVLKIEPNNIISLRNKGISLIHQNNFQDALFYLNRTLEIVPDDSEVLFSKAFVLELLGKENDAKIIYEKALKIEPNNCNILNTFGYNIIDLVIHTKNVRDQNGGLENARSYFNKVLEIDSKNVEAIKGKKYVEEQLKENIEKLEKKQM